MSHDILGVNRRSLSVQDGDSLTKRMETVAVLVGGVENIDYAVYIGHGSPEFVRDNGMKVSFAEAQQHFPDIDRRNYRER